MKKNQKSRVSAPVGKYKNKWIALSQEKREIIAAYRSFVKTVEEANKKGEKDPIMYKVPKNSACLLL